MATIKAVSSRARIGTAIKYITAAEKTERRLISGINCHVDSAEAEMQVTKQIWSKTGGRSYKHFIQAFHADERITAEKAHEIACKLAAKIKAWKGFEVLLATHKDKGHIHTHFIVNSVNITDGSKLQWSKRDLQNMKNCSDELCLLNNLHVCQKGKTFEGEDRDETSAYTKEAYQFLKKAEHGEVKSYIQEIALVILDEKARATSREEFILRMNKRGYDVDWQDKHKYITFTDLKRQEQGESKCKIRSNKLEKYYNMDFGKEGLSLEFKKNARSAAEREAATREYVRIQRAEIANSRAAEAYKRTRLDNSRADRVQRDEIQRRLDQERIQRAAVANQQAAARKQRNKRSRSHEDYSR